LPVGESKPENHATAFTMNRAFFLQLVWFFALAPLQAADDNADSQVQPGVSQGKLTSSVFADSQVFPGTRRDYSIYVPAQYTPDKPASLMVFMDGSGYVKADGAFRVPVVFDNLFTKRQCR